jgi:hypothetical protein
MLLKIVNVVFFFGYVGLIGPWVNYCQKPISKNAQDLILWQQRVETITDSIVKDASSVDSLHRAVYLGLFAKLIWGTDSKQGSIQLKRGFDIILGEIAKEEPIGFEKKLDYSRRLIEIANTLDPAMGSSFSSRLATALKERIANGKLSPESLIAIAIQIAPHNPQLAFSLASKSLSSATHPRIYLIISTLAPKNPVLAQVLFRLALSAARNNYDYEFVGSLGLVLFQVPEPDRRGYFAFLSEVLSAAGNPEGDRSRCKVARLVSANLHLFDQYFPENSQIVRQQIQQCLTFFDVANAEIAAAAASGESIKTPDELVRAARNAQSRSAKFAFFKRAILILEGKKQFDELISLLDDMNSDEVKIVGQQAWDEWRTMAAYDSAKRDFLNGDFPSGYRTINRTPKRVRYDVRFRLVKGLKKPEFRDLTLENLEEARKEMGGLDIPVYKAASGYLNLSRLYLTIQPVEAEGVFRQAVKYINKTDSENEEFSAEKDYSPHDDYVRMPPELLEVDEFSILSSVSSVSSKRSRVRLYLGLLESSLFKVADLKKKVAKELEMQAKEKVQ